MDQKILAIGDTHHPFANHHSLRIIYKIIEELSPTIIIQMGDLYDMFSWSRFPRTQRVMTPQDEKTAGFGDAFEMWDKIRKLSPKGKLFQLMGNHDERPFKMAISRAPELEPFMSMRDMFDFHKVEVSNSEKDELIIHKILFMHGYRSQLGQHVIHNQYTNTVCGHSHVGGVKYVRLGNKIVWELNAGFVGDENSHPMSYPMQRKISTWTQGCGWIDRYGPRFIPFEDK